MKPGDLLKFKLGLGFRWMKNETFICVQVHNDGWCEVLKSDGKLHTMIINHMEVINEFG